MQVRNGLICNRCTPSECREHISETEFVEIECPSCEGYGCEHCTEGYFKLTQCARSFVDIDLTEVLNACSFADRGFLPANGSILDQSAWFLEAWSAAISEQNLIDSERLKKIAGK